MSNMKRVKDVLDIVRHARHPAEFPASLGSRIALALGDKPVIREMHEAALASEAAALWRSLGMHVVIGDSVHEHLETAAQAIDPSAMPNVPPWRPLEQHPVVERAVALGGSAARRLLLDSRSRLYRWLAERLQADQRPERLGGRHGTTRERRAIYVAFQAALAQEACSADAMSGHSEDAEKLGEVLGYPRCCVEAYVALEVCYPNRVTIAASAQRTRRFEPLLNNLSLSRFCFVPHFPCRYDCEASLRQARSIHAVLKPANPNVTGQIVDIFTLPRVYRSESEQLVLRDARRRGDVIEYRGEQELDTAWAGLSESLGQPDDGRPRPLAKRISTEGDELVLPFGL